LTNGTSYTFDVVATNAVGDSGPGRTGAVIPESQKTSPGPPIDASATALVRGAVVVWQAPASDGGSTITGYRVESTPEGFSRIQNGSARSVTASGLKNGTSYTFEVSAINVEGESAPATTNEVTTPTFPGTPSMGATAGDGSALVTWQAPRTNGGSTITSYTVTVIPGGTSFTRNSSTFSAEIPGLTNGTSYTFKGVATNAVGNTLVAGETGAVTPTAGTAQTGGGTPPATGTAQTGGGTPPVTGTPQTGGGTPPVTGTPQTGGGTPPATGTPQTGGGTPSGTSTSGNSWLFRLFNDGSMFRSAGTSTPDGNWLWAVLRPGAEGPSAITGTLRADKYTVLRQQVSNRSWQLTEPGAAEISPLSNREWALAKRSGNMGLQFQNFPLNLDPTAISLLELYASRA
jgi:hypothetical protein